MVQSRGRSIALLTGLITGALVIGPAVNALTAPAARPAALQTRVNSCAGLNFRPAASTTTYTASNAGGGRSMVRAEVGADEGTFDGFFLCDPGLPDGAEITKVQFTIRDVTNQAEVRYCALVRSGLRALSAVQEPDVMAQLPSSGRVATPGVVRRFTTSITTPIVDNRKWGYWLQCQIDWDEATSAADGAGIYGADVTYRIDSSDG